MASSKSGPALEEVFKTQGVPTHTFVEPKEYARLLLALRTPGRGVVIEGPSGIGKTTAVLQALKKLGLNEPALRLSARKADEAEMIRELPTMGDNLGIVVIDDFHRLSDSVKDALADRIKVLADEESTETKFIVVGINRAGQGLVKFSNDIVNRIEIIRFEDNPDYKIVELLEKGEVALNVSINVKQEIVEASQGGFYIAQLLASEVCLDSDILGCQECLTETRSSYESIKARVFDRLDGLFFAKCKTFCQGKKMKRAGRAPYLHLLSWLAKRNDWSLDIKDAIRENPSMRGSVGQVVSKGFLEKFMSENDDELSKILYYDKDSETLTAEDPQFVFYIKNITWPQFAKRVGFISVDIESPYDFALSFAGTDRDVAAMLFERLSEHEMSVFYDKNEQHRILAQDVEDYLRPIYQSGSYYVVCLLGPEYPNRIWTKFESDAFKHRFDDASVVPVWFASAPPGMFDTSRRVGGLSLDRKKALGPQVEEIVETLVKMVEERRGAEQVASAD